MWMIYVPSMQTISAKEKFMYLKTTRNQMVKAFLIGLFLLHIPITKSSLKTNICI